MIRRLFLAVLAAALPLLAVVVTAALPAGSPPASAQPSQSTPAYWLVASDGGIFAFGGAPYYGSTGGMALNKPVVGMAATTDGGGYWLVASDGGVFSYGDANFYGSTGSLVLNKPVVGMAAVPGGGGYWLVASDGGIFAYGDAVFHGSTGSLVLNKPVVGMLAGPGGTGYFLVASDGGIFSFGSAPFYGSLGGQALKRPIVGAAATPTFNGYWMTDSGGLVSNFGAASYYGSAPSPLFRPIVGMAEAPGAGGFFGGTYPSGSYGYDISGFQCGNLPPPPHQVSIVQVDGASGGPINSCLGSELSWAGGSLNLYTYLTYYQSATAAPGCTDSAGACNAGYWAAMHAYNDAVAAGANVGVPWWLDVESNPASIGAWSSNTQLNADFVQGALNALHETEGIASVGIYASPGVWNTIVGNYAPSVPYWMADYLSSPSGPGSCADYTNWVVNHGADLPGPPQIVQYFSGPVAGSTGDYDDDYAC